MELMIFVLMLVVLGYVLYRNYVLISRYRHNKEYVDCYQAMMNDDIDAYDKINAYLEKEKNVDFNNKGKVLKLYNEINTNKDYTSTLNDLNLKDIFYKNGVFSSQQLNLNTDIFIWLNILLAKARQLSKFDVIKNIMDQLNDIEQLNNRIEYSLVRALYNALCEKEDGGVMFMNDLLEGNYVGYEYDKALIGLEKRFAACGLVYSGEPIEDYYKQDLNEFSKNQIGYVFMKALDIYDKYHIEENTLESTEE